jgi:branched-chain amino acid aminotransferase
MTESLAYLNGRIISLSQAHLALNDAGFVLGATVTDFCRTFNHRLYRWPEHLARFQRGCAAANFTLGSDEREITQRARGLVEHNAKLIGAGNDLGLLLFATPGLLGHYLGQPTQESERSTFGMYTFPLPFARYRPWIEKGAVLATPSIRAVPPQCVPANIKHRSRMHWWLAEQEVQRTTPGAQALLLDLDDNVTETKLANFLLVKNGALISPPLESVLDGVSLRVVGELCAKMRVKITHQKVTLDDCYAADEALLTSTGFCLAGVRQINDRAIAWPGPLLKGLLAKWNEEVGMDIHGQIKSNSAADARG